MESNMKILLITLSLIIASVSGAYKSVGKNSFFSVGSNNNAQVPVLRNDFQIQPDGHYSYAYETGNGIQASETGVGGQSVQGSADWIAPDGQQVSLQYTADENGYFPTGSHIHPQLARALEYLRTHPISFAKTSAPQQRRPVAAVARKPQPPRRPNAAANRRPQPYRG